MAKLKVFGNSTNNYSTKESSSCLDTTSKWKNCASRAQKVADNESKIASKTSSLKKIASKQKNHASTIHAMANSAKKLSATKSSASDNLLLIVEDISLSAGIAWLFFDSFWWSIPLMGFVIHFNGIRFNEKLTKEKESSFLVEYKELLRNLISGLETGHSVENAFMDAERVHRQLFGENSILMSDLHALNVSVSLRTPVEKAFYDFARIYPYEEVENFASIFSFGKRLGGNYIENLRSTARKLEEKVDLKQDIAANYAQKQLELSIMSIMPSAIIAYLKIASPNFLEPLYHNLFGVMLMSACLAIYLMAILLGNKIVDIEV